MFDKPCHTDTPTIQRLAVDILGNEVRVYWTNGFIDRMSVKEANERIRVNGIPVIDFYAKHN